MSNSKTFIIGNFITLPIKSVMEIITNYLSSFSKNKELKPLYFEMFYSAFWIEVIQNKCSIRLNVYDWSSRTLHLAKKLDERYEKHNYLK